MPEISLLEPNVLTGLIEKFTAPPESVATSLFPKRSYPETVAKWDVIKGKRERARPTMPNREGKIVGQMGLGQKTSTFIYVREKKAFEPTTLRWLREPGEIAAKNAEAQVRREVVDLNNRLDRLVESYCWEALKGHIIIDEPDVKADVDMGYDATHTPTAGTLWSDAGADIIGNVKAWKKLIETDSGFSPSEIYLSSGVMDYVYNNTAMKAMWSDRLKEQYLMSMTITGFLGFNWHIFDGGFEDESGTFVPYLPDTHILMLSNGGNPFEILEGLSADEDAPTNHTGKFSKTWETKDPSGRFVLVEYNFMPIVTRVENVVYAEVAGT